MSSKYDARGREALELNRSGDPEAGLLLCNKILSENPHDAGAAIIAGDALLKMGNNGLAFHMFRTAAQIEPEWADAWCNMGVALQESRVMEQAKACYMKAFEIDPKNTEVLGNLCAIENDFGEHEKAVAWAKKALEIDPENDHAKYNGSLSLLALQEWSEVWDWYRESIGSKERIERFYGDHVKRWDGTPTDGLVVYTEQGLGDEIIFASMFADVLRDNKSVVIECTKKVEGLFRRSFPDATVYGTRPAKHSEDDWLTWPTGHNLTAKIEAGGLGEFYRRDKNDFPKAPFLRPDPLRRTQWRALLDTLPKKPNIGIAWHAGKVKTKGGERSLNLEDLLPVLKYDANWISLEYSVFDDGEEMSRFSQKHGIEIHRWKHGTETQDYDDTAALVAELDLVVSVTTTVVDLCGGLGKECFVLVPENAPWRCHGDPAWYVGQKFFRQKDGEWPIGDVYASLHKWRPAPFPAPDMGKVYGATYDLKKAPASFDFLSWLLHAKQMAGKRALEVQFINEGDWRKDGLPLSSDERQWMMDHVVRPSIRLIGAKEGKGGAEFEYLLRPVVDGARFDIAPPKFTATPKAKEFVSKWLDGRPLVVVTTREAEYWPERNSDIEAWMAFAGQKWMQGVRVVFVRDTNKAHFKLGRLETAPWASVDLDLRMALYEAADLNLAVNNGPCHLLYFSDCNYIVFKQLVDGVPACSPEWWENNIGVKVGEQYPFAGPYQKLAWVPDTLENIEGAVKQWRSLLMGS